MAPRRFPSVSIIGADSPGSEEMAENGQNGNGNGNGEQSPVRVAVWYDYI